MMPKSQFDTLLVHEDHMSSILGQLKKLDFERFAYTRKPVVVEWLEDIIEVVDSIHIPCVKIFFGARACVCWGGGAQVKITLQNQKYFMYNHKYKVLSYNTTISNTLYDYHVRYQSTQ